MTFSFYTFVSFFQYFLIFSDADYLLTPTNGMGRKERALAEKYFPTNFRYISSYLANLGPYLSILLLLPICFSANIFKIIYIFLLYIF